MRFAASFPTLHSDGTTPTLVRLRLRGTDGTEYGPFAMTGTPNVDYSGAATDTSQFVYDWSLPSPLWSGSAFYAPDDGSSVLEETVNNGALVQAIYASIVPAVASGTTPTDATYRQGETALLTVTGLADMSGNTDLWLAVKGWSGDDDDAALVLLQRTVGLVRLLGASATAGHGTLTGAGTTLAATLDASDGESLPAGTYVWEARMLAAGVVTTVGHGRFTVSRAAVGAVS